MRPTAVRSYFALVTVSLAVAITGMCARRAIATPAPLRPGDHIGVMRLERRTNTGDLISIFNFCNPLILAPGVTHRHCTIPRSRSLFIGWGDFETTYPALNRVWRRERWRLRIDGHDVSLARFGTDDRILYSYPPAAGHDSILREWRVLLVHPTPGRHLIRYVTHYLGSITDVTWTITIDT